MDFPLRRNASAVATIKIRNIAAIPHVLRALGADPESVMRSADVNPALFDSAENVMPYAAGGRLIAECVAATGCDDFGLKVGVRSGPPAIGLTGLVSVNSPTVREGIRVILGTLTTVDTGGTVFLDVKAGVAALGYSVTTPDVDAVDQIEDIAIAIAANVMRRLCGPGWRPQRVRFARRPPRDRTLYAEFFRAPLQFSAGQTCLEFAASTLDAPVAGHDPGYADVLAPLLQEAVANATPDFLSSVKSVVRGQLAAGSLSRGSVCGALGLNARTFANRLEGFGVSYSSLADEARFDTARSLLLKDRRIDEVAVILGFADQSAFTRAFKAWSGTTPARWRALQATAATGR